MKKLLAILLAVAMVIAVAPAVFAEETTTVVGYDTVNVTDGTYWGGEQVSLNSAVNGAITFYTYAEDSDIDVDFLSYDEKVSAIVAYASVINGGEYHPTLFGGKSDGTGKVNYTVIQITAEGCTVLEQGSANVRDGSWGEELAINTTGDGTLYIYVAAEDTEKAPEVINYEENGVEFTSKKAMIFTKNNHDADLDSYYIWGGKSDSTGVVSYVAVQTVDSSAGGNENSGDASGTLNNPEVLENLDSVSVDLTDVNGGKYDHYYAYTLTANGELEVTYDTLVSGLLGLYIGNDSDSGLGSIASDMATVDEQGTDYTANIKGNVGDVVYIWIKNLMDDDKPVTVNISFNFTAGAGRDEEPEKKTLTVDDAEAAPELTDDQDWEFVEVTDDVVDEAILGADGYYHLNSATGPILYIDLKNDDYMSLTEYTRWSTFKDGYTYQDLLNAYLAAAPDGVVALTEDLVALMKSLKVDYAWYFDVDEVYDDAWMFLCKYIVGDDVEENPPTSDAIVTVAAALAVSMSGVAVLFKKKEF